MFKKNIYIYKKHGNGCSEVRREVVQLSTIVLKHRACHRIREDPKWSP